MKWSEVEERIGLLIRQNEYLTEEELKLVQSKKEESIKERYELNPKETMYARTKQEELQETFKSWVMNHSEVLEELHAIYFLFSNQPLLFRSVLWTDLVNINFSILS